MWGFPWATVAEDRLVEVQQHLNLTDVQFERLRADCDQALNRRLLGWPDVWLDLSAARTFYQTYLKHVDAVKLIAIGLSSRDVDDALSDLAPLKGSDESGVYHVLTQRRILPDGYTVRGYDILGSEYGGSFHSFFCNGLEQAYQEILHVELNDQGLVNEYGAAQQAANYTNLETTGAEPVPWYPWLIVEYPL
jgi:hypothetical protein